MKTWLLLLLSWPPLLLAHTGPHLVVTPVAGIAVDGDFADWPRDAEWHVLDSPQPGSLAARFAVGLDRERTFLNVAVEVTDDNVVVRDAAAGDLVDGLQIFVDPVHRAARDGVVEYSFTDSFAAAAPRLAGTATGARRVSGNRLAYEFQIDLRKLEGERGWPPGDHVIGFDLTVLDGDGPGRIARLSWTPGDDKATNAQLGDAWLLSTTAVPVTATGRTAWQAVERQPPPRRVQARRVGDATFVVTAPTDAQGRFSLPLPPGEYEFRAADTLGLPVLRPKVLRRVSVGADTVNIAAPLLARPLAGTLDALMPRLLADYDVRAAQVAVIENGKLETSRAWGIDRAGKPATRDTVFRVASITKVITTMTVMNLVEQGKWDLDQPLSNYWIDPDLAGDARSRRLTTRLVLQHRTGLPNWRDGKLQFEFDPGERNQYSGEGLEWLRRALEKATGETLEALATRLVFTPAGMKSTTYLWPAWVPPRYSGEYTGDTFVGYDNEPDANGAADLMSTAEDLARFGIWVMQGGGLSAKTWREIEDTSANARGAGPDDKLRGLGWVVTRDGPRGETLVIHHGGGQRGIATELLLVPVEKRGLVVLTNGSAGRPLLLGALNATLNAQGGFPRLQYFIEDRARD